MEEDMGLSFDSTIKVKKARTVFNLPIFSKNKKSNKKDYISNTTKDDLKISGADKQWEEDMICSNCEYKGSTIKSMYGNEIFWGCPQCHINFIETDTF